MLLNPQLKAKIPLITCQIPYKIIKMKRSLVKHLMSKMPLAIEIVMGITNRFDKLSQGIKCYRYSLSTLKKHKDDTGESTVFRATIF
jgi:hypothetical protein